MAAAAELPARQLRFVHITKNAGTTIEEIGRPLWGRYDADYRDATSDVYRSPWDWWHIPPQFMAKDSLTALKKKYDYFLVVRNPFDRVVSEYYCEWGGPAKKWHDAARANAWIQQRLDALEQAISAFESNKAAGGKRMPGRTYPALEGHWIPQHIYLVDANGATLVPDANVVRFENLAADFRQLMARYGYPESFCIDKAAHLNKSRTGNGTAGSKPQEQMFTAQQLSPDNIARIRRIYRQDFELFGYAEDPPPPKAKPLPTPAEAPAQPPAARAEVRESGDEQQNKKRRTSPPPPPPAQSRGPVVGPGKQSLSALLAAYKR